MCTIDLKKIEKHHTPFYLYDLKLLRSTLATIKKEIEGTPFIVHYAIKANANPVILKEIREAGMGVDLVSGNEVRAALDAGFATSGMAFAGVGKADWEIELALDNELYCLNVESSQELEVINAIAASMGKTACIALRVNPNIDAHTHKFITTGTDDNKFGFHLSEIDEIIHKALRLPNIHLRGLHFHIGSQIMSLEPYKMLCHKINELLDHYEQQGIHFEMIDAGGGLGVDYENPEQNTIAAFHDFFGLFKRELKLRPGQTVHFELGRSIVAQCGTLISQVLYVKKSPHKRFVILDAGMTCLIRPALYGAHHKIVNLTSTSQELELCDVVGPICESSDVFAAGTLLPATKRGDWVAILTAGAYGESMASCYNMRSLPASHFIE